MSELIRALDCSVYSGRTSAQWWRDRYAEGWRMAVVGSWHGNSTNPFVRDQMGFAQDAGMMLATYVALSQFHGGDEQVAKARYACGDFWPQLEFVALDMELPGLTGQHLDCAVRPLQKYLASETICYTGYWWWSPWQRGHGYDWPDLPAWVAYYDGRASLDAAPIVTGGPIRPLAPLTGLGPIIGKQYAGTTYIDGVAVDLNVFDASFLKEEDMRHQALIDLRLEEESYWQPVEAWIQRMRVVLRQDFDEEVGMEYEGWDEGSPLLQAAQERTRIMGRPG